MGKKPVMAVASSEDQNHSDMLEKPGWEKGRCRLNEASGLGQFSLTAGHAHL